METETQVYLDPELLLSGKGERTVREVYPFVYHKHRLDESDWVTPSGNGSAVLARIIETPEWKGFAILDSSHQDIAHRLPQFQPPDYQGLNRTALYLNDELICEYKHATRPRDFYDLELGFTLSIKGAEASRTRW